MSTSILFNWIIYTFSSILFKTKNILFSFSGKFQSNLLAIVLKVSGNLIKMFARNTTHKILKLKKKTSKNRKHSPDQPSILNKILAPAPFLTTLQIISFIVYTASLWYLPGISGGFITFVEWRLATVPSALCRLACQISKLFSGECRLAESRLSFVRKSRKV